MSSSTVSRYRESTVVVTTTTPTKKIFDQDERSFAEEDALDAIAKQVCT